MSCIPRPAGGQSALLLLYSHPLFRKHRTGHGHPECSERLDSIEQALRAKGLWDRCRAPEFKPASEDDLRLVHTAEHVAFVKACGQQTPFRIDGETVMSKDSWDAALLAAGACIDAADRIAAGEDSRALCLVRPPGHHATPHQSMGFCLFNNIAIAAEHLKRRHGVERILIADFDVHHGNGTQDAFWNDPAVFYVSTHRAPFYPGSGAKDEAGEGEGKGFTLNIPFDLLDHGDDVALAWKKALARISDEFKPQYVLVSAGFDAWKNDPIGGLNFEIRHFAEITGLLVDAANATADGRIISTLEGGYDVDRLGTLVAAHLEAML
ncbi:MAG: histone deacetylase [Planctomycetota bacterium]